MPAVRPSPWCRAAESGRSGPNLEDARLEKNTKTRSLENVDSRMIEIDLPDSGKQFGV